jgi:hypothetical protein
VEVALTCENDHFPYAKASDVHAGTMAVRGNTSLLPPLNWRSSYCFINVGAFPTAEVEPSISGEDDDLRDGVPDFSSDNGDSSEAKQGRWTE